MNNNNNNKIVPPFLSSEEFNLDSLDNDSDYDDGHAVESAATRQIPTTILDDTLTSSNKYAGRLLPFPHRLQHMLEDVEKRGKQDIVSWMPCGKLFKVHNPAQFVKEVAPVYFNLTQYKSFKRQLLNYGFVRAEINPRTSKEPWWPLLYIYVLT
jgi:hypothetical protein